ncbi:MAG: hypothetical protein IJR89_06090 [Clostridia bacterium]|nr:hypothetical protein [Clostridia bacterium]
MKLRRMIPILLALALLLCACGRNVKPTDTDATPTTPLLPDSITETAEVPSAVSSEPAATKPQETETAPAESDPIRGEIPADPAAKLGLSLDWTAQPLSENRYRITVILSLNSFSIFAGERSDGELSLGTRRITYHSDKIEYEGTKKTKIALTEYTFEYEFSGTGARSVPVSASWRFGGVYAGTPVDWLTLDGTILLDRTAR